MHKVHGRQGFRGGSGLARSHMSASLSPKRYEVDRSSSAYPYGHVELVCTAYSEYEKIDDKVPHK